MLDLWVGLHCDHTSNTPTHYLLDYDAFKRRYFNLIDQIYLYTIQLKKYFVFSGKYRFGVHFRTIGHTSDLLSNQKHSQYRDGEVIIIHNDNIMHNTL